MPGFWTWQSKRMGEKSGEKNDSGAVLSLGVQWCGLLECSRFYKGAISCSIIRQALPTMEMSYWHHLSSRNMRQGWRARDLSWQFYCSHNSVMALLTGSHPPRLLQTFVTQIALLIRSPSVLSSLFFSEPDLKPLKLIHIFVRAALPPPRRHRHVFVPTARVGTQWAEIRFFPVTALVTTHTCSVTLMEMTELQECLEVSALTVPLPLGNVCHPALRKCHYRFVSMRWQRRRAGLLQEHTIYISRTDIYSRHNIRCACKWVKYNSASFVIP